jgi:hypothetical protein
MYRTPEREDLLSQGDIFHGKFAFPYTANLLEDYLILRGDTDTPHSQVPNAWSEGNEVLLVPSFATNFAIILSNSCDAEPNVGDPLEFITMGAILPMTTLPEDGKRGDCRRNRIVRLLPLDAFPESNLPESYVHFGLIALVRQEALLAAKETRILALTSPHREALGHRFGEFFSRVALP